MKKFLLLLFLSFSVAAVAQKRTYNIFLFGDKIGSTTLERILANDSTVRYTLHSASEAKILFSTRKVSLQYEIVYRNDQLISSYSKNIRNDEVNEIKVNWNGIKYMVSTKGKVWNVLAPIFCSSVKFYYEVPCGDSKIFSERLGQFCPLKKVSASKYECEMSEGVTYIFNYTNGEMTELEMKKGLLGSLYLRLAK